MDKLARTNMQKRKRHLTGVYFRRARALQMFYDTHKSKTSNFFTRALAKVKAFGGRIIARIKSKSWTHLLDSEKVPVLKFENNVNKNIKGCKKTNFINTFKHSRISKGQR